MSSAANLGYDALVTVSVASLSPSMSSALRYVDAHHLLDARPEFNSRIAAAEAHGTQHYAAVTGLTLSEVSLPSFSLLAEDRTQQTLFGSRVLLALELV